MIQAFSLRVGEATQDALVPPAVNVNNGDTALYADKGGTYTKGLPHDNFGRVDLKAFATFTNALNSGKFSDFEKIIMGGTRTLNGPQAGLAFDLERIDNVQFGQPQVPPAPRSGQRPERHRAARTLLGFAAPRRGLYRLRLEPAGRSGSSGIGSTTYLFGAEER